MIPLLLLLSLAAPQDLIYQADFAAGVGGFSVHWNPDGELTAAVEDGLLRIDAVGPARGTVGVRLPNEGEQAWAITVRGAAELSEGSAFVGLQCLDARGEQVDWVGVGGLPAGAEPRLLKAAVTVPAAATQVNLLLVHEGAVGTTRIAEVAVRRLDVDALLADQAPAGPTRWGATSFPRSDEPTLRDTGAKLLVAAGVDHTRIGIDWRRAEPEPGKFDFSSLEHQLDTLARYGASAPVVFIHGTPEWASGKRAPDDMLPERAERGMPWVGRAFWPPADWALWERFVRELVTHFRGRVPVWEIMNEPDLWGEGFNGTYEDYVEYLTRAARTARAADPECEIACAAFVFDQWLPRLLSDGHADAFDAVCSHPYHSQPLGTLSRVRRVQLLLALHDAPKPVLITEMGFQSGGWKEGPGVKEGEAAKAEAGRIALAALREASDLIIWYTALERGHMYGLLRDDGDRYRPMPIFFDYGRLTGRLTGDSPLQTTVTAPATLGHGAEAAVTLTVENTGAEPVAVRFWPVGFVTALGGSLPATRAAEWQGALAPGERHTATLTLRPTAEAKGDYPVGLAIVSPAGNALELVDVGVE